MSLDVSELMALRRVSEGGVTMAEGCYVHNARPVAGELAEALVRLHTAGCVTIGASGPGGHLPVHTTVTGAARLAELSGGGPPPQSPASRRLSRKRRLRPESPAERPVPPPEPPATVEDDDKGGGNMRRRDQPKEPDKQPNRHEKLEHPSRRDGQVPPAKTPSPREPKPGKHGK